MRQAADEGGNSFSVSFDTLIEAMAVAMDMRQLIPVDKVEAKFSMVGFPTGHQPVTIGEIKGMKNVTIVKVEFGCIYIKILKLGRGIATACGGGDGGEGEEMEKKEKGRGQFKEHFFLGCWRIEVLKLGIWFILELGTRWKLWDFIFSFCVGVVK